MKYKQKFNLLIMSLTGEKMRHESLNNRERNKGVSGVRSLR